MKGVSKSYLRSFRSGPNVLKMSVPPLIVACVTGLQKEKQVKCEMLRLRKNDPPSVALRQPTKRNEEKNWQKKTFSQLRVWSSVIVLAARLWLLALPVAVCTPVAWIGPKWFEEWLWQYALWATQRAGPTVVKLAQWLSSRDDRFPAKFCSRFSVLQDAGWHHSWRETEQALDTGLGSRWRDFLKIEREPIGAGCVAQVYKGSLLKDVAEGGGKSGDIVAIKVVHPHARRRVELDLQLLRSFASLLEALSTTARFCSVVDACDEFAHNLSDQMNMLREAENLDRLATNFRTIPQVSFPRPRPALCSDDVLVEDYIDGIRIREFLQTHQPSPAIRTELAKIGVNAICKMIFHDNFLHGDLHPGNLLVTKDLKICLLDAGIVVELKPSQHEHFVDVLAALMRHDGETAGRLMIDHQYPSDGQQIAAETDFCTTLSSITDKVADEPFFDNIGRYTSRIFDSAVRSRIRLEGYFVSTTVAIRVMEGIANALDKDVKIGDLAMPWIITAPQFARALSSPFDDVIILLGDS